MDVFQNLPVTFAGIEKVLRFQITSISVLPQYVGMVLLLLSVLLLLYYLVDVQLMYGKSILIK